MVGRNIRLIARVIIQLVIRLVNTLDSYFNYDSSHDEVIYTIYTVGFVSSDVRLQVLHKFCYSKKRYIMYRFVSSDVV